MERNEEETLRRVADGDVVELEILCRRHATKLCNFAYRLLWNWADAEEVVQKTMFRVFKLALDGQFDEEPGAFMATMYGIARGLCVDKMSERRPSKPDTGTKPAGKVDDALAKLNSDLRSPLLLKDYNGLDYSEIARVLDCSTKHVKMLVYRGRRQMADVVRDGD